jgi:hypothetical protein
VECERVIATEDESIGKQRFHEESACIVIRFGCTFKRSNVAPRDGDTAPGHKFSLVFFHQLCECRVPFLCHANRAFNGHIDGQRSHVRKEMIHLPRFFPLPALAICNGYDVGS